MRSERVIKMLKRRLKAPKIRPLKEAVLSDAVGLVLSEAIFRTLDRIFPSSPKTSSGGHLGANADHVM